MKLFGREPALWIAFAAALIQVLSALVLDLSVEVQGGLNAVIVAGFGVGTALAVRGDTMVPVVLGFFKAVIALAVSFGANLSPENQAIVMVLLGTIAAIVVRDRVIAPVPPDEVAVDCPNCDGTHRA